MDINEYICLPVVLTQEDALLLEGSEKLYRVGWIPEVNCIGFVTRGINKHGWVDIEAVRLIESGADNEGCTS